MFVNLYAFSYHITVRPTAENEFVTPKKFFKSVVYL